MRIDNHYITKLLCFTLFFFMLFTNFTYAKSSTEISEEINKNTQKINDLKQNVNKIKDDLNKLQSQNQNLSKSLDDKLNDISKLEKEQNKILDEIKKNNDEIDHWKTEVEKENSQIIYQIKTIHSSIVSPSNFLGQDDNYIQVAFSKRYIENSTEKITINNSLIIEQSKEIAELQIVKDTIGSKKQELNVQKENLLAQKKQVGNVLSSTNNEIKNLQKQILSVQSLIAQLSKEQKDAEDREREILSSQSNTTKIILTKGEIYFEGRGRDLYDGHGVGFSQWGSYGAGLKGIDYQTIVKSYYTGVNIIGGYENLSINIQGIGKLSMDDYLSGLGEIPSMACEDSKNIGKSYVKKDDKSTYWDCFPEEAIKAQIVAARSYAVANVIANPGKIFPKDDSFQVYIGGNAKRWAVDSTKGQVIALNNKPVAAYFTASVRGQSENNENVWTSKSVSSKSAEDIKGTPSSYLKSINDSAWALRTSTYDLQWKTSSFSLSKLKEILTPSIGDIGDIRSITTHKGGSNRIFALTISGSSKTMYIAGWKFKALINDYLYTKTKDNNYFLSTEFSITEVK